MDERVKTGRFVKIDEGGGVYRFGHMVEGHPQDDFVYVTGRKGRIVIERSEDVESVALSDFE